MSKDCAIASPANSSSIPIPIQDYPPPYVDQEVYNPPRQESFNPNVFIPPLTTPRQTAMKMHAHAINVIPCGLNRRPLPELGEWGQWKTQLQTDKDVGDLPWSSIDTTVGLISGISGLRCMDIDAEKEPPTMVEEELLLEVLSALGLPENYEWAERSVSGLGFHIYFTCRQGLWDNTTRLDYPSKDGRCSHIELRWRDCYTILSPNSDLYLRPPTVPPTELDIKEVMKVYNNFVLYGASLSPTAYLNVPVYVQTRSEVPLIHWTES